MWTLGFVLGGVVVLIVAVLLITILSVARKIQSLATTALSVAGDIEIGTKPIWALGTANNIVENIVRNVRSVDARVNAVADKLDGGAS